MEFEIMLPYLVIDYLFVHVVKSTCKFSGTNITDRNSDFAGISCNAFAHFTGIFRNGICSSWCSRSGYDLINELAKNGAVYRNCSSHEHPQYYWCGLPDSVRPYGPYVFHLALFIDSISFLTFFPAKIKPWDLATKASSELRNSASSIIAASSVKSSDLRIQRSLPITFQKVCLFFQTWVEGDIHWSLFWISDIYKKEAEYKKDNQEEPAIPDYQQDELEGDDDEGSGDIEKTVSTGQWDLSEELED